MALWLMSEEPILGVKMIKKIILKNFKSHIDSEFTFTPGLNLIYGKNGGGKTSIIEAIGFALFDYTPHTKEQLTTYGKKIGSVTVEMEDGTQFYRDTKNAYNIKTSAGLEISGKEDVISFIKTYFSMDDPAEIFSDIIGVRQSYQIAQFLQTPREKKNTFDRLFGVETYDTLWKMLKPLEIKIQEEKHIHEVNKARYDGIASSRSTLESRKVEIQKSIGELSIKSEDLSKQITQLSEQECKLSSVIHEIEGKKNLENDVKSLEQRIESLKLTIARRASALRDKPQIFELVNEQDMLEAKVSELGRLEALFTNIQQRNAEIDIQITQCVEAITYLEHRQESLPTLEDKAKNLKELDTEYERLKTLKIKLETEQSTLQTSLEKARTGICPLSGGKCSQGVEVDIGAKLHEVMLSLRTTVTETEETRLMCADAKNATFDLEQLRREREDIIKMKKLLNNCTSEKQSNIARLNEFTGRLSELPEIRSRLLKIGNPKFRLGQIDGFLENTSKTEDELKKCESDLDIFKTRLSETKVNEDSKLVKQATEVKQKLSETHSELGATRRLIQERESEMKRIDNEIQTVSEAQNKSDVMTKEIGKLEAELAHIIRLRSVFRSIPEKLVRARVYRINANANELFNSIFSESSKLSLGEDYDIVLENSKGKRIFTQMSGGEEMLAAVCIRVSVLKEISKSNFIFFDEPTQSLDYEHRLALAESIGKLKAWEGLKQIFVISHDDSFSPHADNIIELF